MFLHLPIRDYRDILSFSSYVANYYGDFFVEDNLLSGDAVLIKRSVIDAIGVMDTRFFGYFGDADYGLRVQRAGYKLVCAKGAWLYHVGAGHVRQESVDKKEAMDIAHQKRMNLVQLAYRKFREKWEMSLPELYPGVLAIDFRKLRGKKVEFDEYQAPLEIQFN